LPNQVLKDISPWPWALLHSNDVLLITRLGYHCILNIICFSLGFHIIFVCKIDICLDIVLYFTTFDPYVMLVGPVIIISESTCKDWKQDYNKSMRLEGYNLVQTHHVYPALKPLMVK
jgi:hypothetical protein